MGAVEQLCDIEEIRQVKHRYLRCVDLKLWDEIGDTLTECATLDTGTSAFGKLVEITGRAEIVAFFSAKLGPAMLTGHTASQPEITVDGDTATGIWSYRETVLSTRHRMVIAGTGFCEERYERCADARWRIARIGYLRSYEAMASLDDLPSFKVTAALGRPSAAPAAPPGIRRWPPAWIPGSYMGREGLGRSIRLLRLFRSEQADPELYYTVVAEDAVQQVAGYCELSGRTVLDVGGGGGWFTAAFRAQGARCYLFEPDSAELYSRKDALAGAVIADGLRLPVRDGAADVAFSSNVLEHVPDPMRLIGEMIRVTRPDGLIYLAFTNWYSPWGGHEMSPWHYLGPAIRRTQVLQALPAQAQAQGRREPVPAERRVRAAHAASANRHRDRRRAPPLLPAVVPSHPARSPGCVRSPPGTSCWS